ncbi:MAG: hypothetical protein II951_03495 [Bacteroidales bacterium]|nr:hypothetical protein [Bacteroidales bacterium]
MQLGIRNGRCGGVIRIVRIVGVVGIVGGRQRILSLTQRALRHRGVA